MELKGFSVFIIVVVVSVYFSETSSIGEEKIVPEENRFSLVQQPNTQDIRDIKGAIKPYRRSPYIIIGLVSTSLLGIIGVYLMIKRKKEKIIPLLPVHETAYEALEGLKRKDLIRMGKTREHYIELSGIVRHYLQNRFGIKTSNMTTEEFLIEIEETEELSSEHKKLLKDFLTHCDLVKFAGYEPLSGETDWSFRLAEEIIKQLKKISLYEI